MTVSTVIDDISRVVDGRNSTKGNQIGFCPGHDDTSRSFTFKMGDNGAPLLKCWAGCEFEFLRSCLINKGVKKELLEKAAPNGNKKEGIGIRFFHSDVGSFISEFDRWDVALDCIYKFHDENGRFVAFKARFKPKTFRQYIYNGYDRIKAGKLNGLPYRLPEIIGAVKDGCLIHIFEGEKDADNGYELGLETTSFGCATDPLPHEYWTKFAGAACVVWADNDKPGIIRAENIARALHVNDCKVKVIIPPKGKDFSDWLQAGATIDDIGAIIKATPQWLPASEVIDKMAAKGTMPRTDHTIGSEAFAGDYFAHKFSRKLRFAVDFQKFIHFNGKIWEKDNGGIHQELAKSIAFHLRADLKEVDEIKRVAMEKLASKAESDSGRKAIISCAKTVPAIKLDTALLDDYSTKHLLCCDDGVIDLRSGTVLAHSPDYLLTKYVPQKIDFEGEPTRFLKFVNETFFEEEVVEWLLNYLGYCLTGETWFQKFVMWRGLAGCGKSQLQAIMRGLLGPHCGDLDAKSLEKTKHTTAAVESDIAQIRGQRLIFSSELAENQNLDEQLIKKITGGDVLRPKLMGQNKFSMTASCKLILTANLRPNLSDDDGIARRLIEVQFLIKPQEEIASLAEKILAAESSKIFGYLVKRAIKTYDKPSCLNVPPVLLGWTKDYLEEMDYLKQWNDTKAQFVSGLWTPSRMVFESIEEYCRENHIPLDVTQNMMSRRLQKFGYKPHREDGRRGWKNIMLR